MMPEGIGSLPATAAARLASSATKTPENRLMFTLRGDGKTSRSSLSIQARRKFA
jgi:hypothetical protein